MEEATTADPVLEQLEAERARTADVHAALRRKQSEISARLAELRAEPGYVARSFRCGTAEVQRTEKFSESSACSDEGQGMEHQRQGSNESVLRDVLNVGSSGQGMTIPAVATDAATGLCHTHITTSCLLCPFHIKSNVPMVTFCVKVAPGDVLQHSVVL